MNHESALRVVLGFDGSPMCRRQHARRPLAAIPRLLLSSSLLLLGCVNGRPSAIPLGDGPVATAELAKQKAIRVEREKQQRAARLKVLAAGDEDSASWSPAWDEVEPESSDEDQGDSDDAGTAVASSDKETETKDETDASKDAGKDSDAAAELAIAGDYLGEDKSLYRFDGAPDRHEEDKAARTRVTKHNDKSITITPLDSSNGDEICDLEAELQGDSAKIKRNQHCFDQDSGEVALSGTVTSGSASFKGGRLVLDLELDLAMDLGEEVIKGSLKYHFEGDKKDKKKKGR